MTKAFEYLVRVTKEAEIVIDDTGNTCIEAMNDSGVLFYLIIKTNGIGWTKVLTYGPVCDSTDNPHECSCILNCFEYDDYKIDKAIRSFLTDHKKRITSAFEVDAEDIKDRLKDIKEYIYN